MFVGIKVVFFDILCCKIPFFEKILIIFAGFLGKGHLYKMYFAYSLED